MLQPTEPPVQGYSNIFININSPEDKNNYHLIEKIYNLVHLSKPKPILTFPKTIYCFYPMNFSILTLWSFAFLFNPNFICLPFLS